MVHAEIHADGSNHWDRTTPPNRYILPEQRSGEFDNTTSSCSVVPNHWRISNYVQPIRSSVHHIIIADRVQYLSDTPVDTMVSG
mmetsp:Transcript_13851/g.20437  ORF Transcript_13851/g.20437 Transcript_13851/m.20437 type:complete len:84 (+) Transcript_13851:330-581(+)